MLIILGILAFVSHTMQEVGNETVGIRVTNKMRNKLFKSLLAKDIAWYDNKDRSVSVNLAML